jgi:hypothetical protein
MGKPTLIFVRALICFIEIAKIRQVIALFIVSPPVLYRVIVFAMLVVMWLLKVAWLYFKKTKIKMVNSFSRL